MPEVYHFINDFITDLYFVISYSSLTMYTHFITTNQTRFVKLAEQVAPLSKLRFLDHNRGAI